MTSLENLTDVGDLSGASDGDYLGHDDTSGLWVPMAPPAAGAADWVANTGTLTYPAGDNGWTYVNDATGAPIEARHIQATTSIPAEDAALIDTINVTSAMVNVGTSGLTYPPNIGLSVVISGRPVNGTGFVGWRMALERNGVMEQYRSTNVNANTVDRVAADMRCTAEDGDIIKVHSWLQDDLEANGVDFDVIVATPIVIGFNIPPSSEDGDIMLLWLPTVPSYQQVQTAPDGIDMSVTGGADPMVRHMYQSGPNAGDVELNVTTNRVLFGLKLPPDRQGTPYMDRTSTATSTSTGVPLLIRQQQFTSYEFWTAQIQGVS